MTGLTSSVKFNEIATKAQVSWRTASRLENIVILIGNSLDSAPTILYGCKVYVRLSPNYEADYGSVPL